MKLENRSIAKMIILSIVTCGIYGIVWNVKLARDAVHVKDANDDGTLEILLMIFLFPIGAFLAEKKFAEGCQAKGIEHKDNSVLYLVLGFLALGIVDIILMQSELNKIADMGIDLAVPAYDMGYQNACDPYQAAPQQAPYNAYQQAPQAPVNPYSAGAYQAPQDAPVNPYSAGAYQAPVQPEYQQPVQPEYQPQAPVDNQFGGDNNPQA